jgi:hypothetical protein
MVCLTVATMFKYSTIIARHLWLVSRSHQLSPDRCINHDPAYYPPLRDKHFCHIEASH